MALCERGACERTRRRDAGRCRQPLRPGQRRAVAGTRRGARAGDGADASHRVRPPVEARGAGAPTRAIKFHRESIAPPLLLHQLPPLPFHGRDAFGVLHQGVEVEGLRHGAPALHRRSGANGLVPPSEVWELGQVDAGPGGRTDPTPGRDIGDGVVAGQVLDVGQSLVEDPVESLRLVPVAIDRERDALGRVPLEDEQLPLHGTDASHLEHEPLHGDATGIGVFR